MKRLIILMIVSFAWPIRALTAQSLFSEKFEDCNGDRFALERDTTTAKIDPIQFVEELKQHLGQDTAGRIRGVVQLQIIVDPQGNSCLLSFDNSTNIEADKISLKSWIDTKLDWGSPPKKVGVIIELEFNEFGIGYRRLGMDGEKGWHYLD